MSMNFNDEPFCRKLFETKIFMCRNSHENGVHISTSVLIIKTSTTTRSMRRNDARWRIENQVLAKEIDLFLHLTRLNIHMMQPYIVAENKVLLNFIKEKWIYSGLCGAWSLGFMGPWISNGALMRIDYISEMFIVYRNLMNLLLLNVRVT